MPSLPHRNLNFGAGEFYFRGLILEIMARFALYPNTVKISQLLPTPPGLFPSLVGAAPMSERLVQSSVGGWHSGHYKSQNRDFRENETAVPFGDKNLLLRPHWGRGWEGEISGINSFNSSVLPSIVSQIPFKARQVP